jgi:hypothetical protein
VHNIKISELISSELAQAEGQKVEEEESYI